jgi:hypothetical protein
VRIGKPYFPRALLLVTNGSLFWMVAVGPEKTAMRGLGLLGVSAKVFSIPLNR